MIAREGSDAAARLAAQSQNPACTRSRSKVCGAYTWNEESGEHLSDSGTHTNFEQTAAIAGTLRKPCKYRGTNRTRIWVH